MSWKLSQFRAGDVVEVRTKEEILATLDERGCVDGMPFMPEMLSFCGQRFPVSAVAHKTCDTVRKTGGRRLQSAVHLAGLRCNGSAHGGCQADCNLFWKDVWLKPANQDNARSATEVVQTCGRGISENQLLANTCPETSSNGAEARFFCQATQVHEATELLKWWDVRQYVRDVTTRNHSVGHVLKVLWLASIRGTLRRLPFGYRVFNFFNNWVHRMLTGRPSPLIRGLVPSGTPTPTGRLNLKPGERVRIKPQKEIEKTLDATGRNRGLTFDFEEMAPYCEGVFTVRNSVNLIIDEPSGKMIPMKQPCIILEGVICNSEYAQCRLNCPRAIPSYWREIWLERVEPCEAPYSKRQPENAAADYRSTPANGTEVAKRVALPLMNPDHRAAAADLRVSV